MFIGDYMLKGLFTKRERYICAVIAAGGSSTRMKGQNKLLADICGAPVLVRTLQAFEKCPLINEIILSAHESYLEGYAAIIKEYNVSKLSKIVKGGESRMHSVYNAAVCAPKKTDVLLVHDAARPLITCKDIELVIADILKHKCASASNIVTDTVKSVESSFAKGTIDRNTLRTVQTPQGGDKDLILSALYKAIKENNSNVTDECSALEAIGITPYMSDTSRTNIKITYPEDIILANAVYDRRARICE